MTVQQGDRVCLTNAAVRLWPEHMGATGTVLRTAFGVATVDWDVRHGIEHWSFDDLIILTKVAI